MKGDIIFADDGTFKVHSKKGVQRYPIPIAHAKGVFKSAKGINVPHINIKGDLITKRDKNDFFCKEIGVDFIGISFCGVFISTFKKIRRLTNSQPKIVAKVENSQGMKNLEAIIQETDVIMIDRGDLSTETNIGELSVTNQKKMTIPHCFRNQL